jgi:hypothetical protein
VPPQQTADNPGRADQHALCCARFPDPETPVGARGVGEPPVGARLGSVLSAIADAVGDDIYHRILVTPNVVLTSLEAGRRVHDVLTAYISICCERSR